MDAETNQLLMALISVTGRNAYPPAELRGLVGGPKQVQAYNLCDGTRTQIDIVKACKLDVGNFSRTVSRWIELGIMFRIGTGREARLLHLYRITDRAKD